MSLGDLGHFGRRREAFQRRREDRVGLGRVAGGLVQLGERQRAAQTPAAGALLFRDGEGGLEGFLSGTGTRRIALEQDLAAGPVELHFERAVAEAIGRRQRFVEDRDGATDVACF